MSDVFARRKPLTVPRILVVAAAVVIFAVHPVLTLLDLPLWALGILDEIAHLSTALIVVAAWPIRIGRPVILVALASAVAVDVDHVLQYVGIDVLTEGTVRPYPHSLTTPLVAFALASALRGTPRRIALGVGAGVLAHLLRDVATGPGIAALWPLSDATVRIPWGFYGATMAGLSAIAWTAARRLPHAREEL